MRLLCEHVACAKSAFGQFKWGPANSHFWSLTYRRTAMFFFRYIEHNIRAPFSMVESFYLLRPCLVRRVVEE